MGARAELAAEAGLDGIEISAAHRYLVEQFLDPELNLREDDWRDGSRFLAEVLDAVRAAAPGLCLGVRLSADSPRAPDDRARWPSEGVDYLSFALGDSSTYLGSVGIVPPPPVEEAAIGATERFESGCRESPPRESSTSSAPTDCSLRAAPRRSG